MRPSNFDPTAGERARAIRVDSEAPQLSLDPTDPRYGKPVLGSIEPAGEPRRIVDPTDPECGAELD